MAASSSAHSENREFKRASSIGLANPGAYKGARGKETYRYHDEARRLSPRGESVLTRLVASGFAVTLRTD
jgi:hypothetical protein